MTESLTTTLTGGKEKGLLLNISSSAHRLKKTSSRLYAFHALKERLQLLADDHIAVAIVDGKTMLEIVFRQAAQFFPADAEVVRRLPNGQ